MSGLQQIPAMVAWFVAGRRIPGSSPRGRALAAHVPWQGRARSATSELYEREFLGKTISGKPDIRSFGTRGTRLRARTGEFTFEQIRLRLKRVLASPSQILDSDAICQ